MPGCPVSRPSNASDAKNCNVVATFHLLDITASILLRGSTISFGLLQLKSIKRKILGRIRNIFS
jgi:hypothetical protein